MCQVAYVNEEYCASQNELRHALGLKKLPMNKGGKFNHNHCLCPVDMKKAARQAKFKFKYDGSDWYLTK